jgi:hypothetical protein
LLLNNAQEAWTKSKIKQGKKADQHKIGWKGKEMNMKMDVILGCI